MHFSETLQLWMPHEEGQDIAIEVISKEVDFIDTVMEYVHRRNACVQAGGHIGMYPIRLAKYFKTVYTFEPNTKNWECLVKNTKAYPNIIVLNKGLSDKKGEETFLLDKNPDGRANSGSAFVKDGDFDLPSFTKEVIALDDVITEQVDFIQLDVEGHEYEVLKGAEQIIKKYKPVLMLEGHIKHEQMLALLKSWGYYFILSKDSDGVFKK
jgi:FkbM family methyltransferase